MNESKFLKEVETRSGLARDQAYRVAIAVFQELHDRLSPKEADDLAAQLPGKFKRMWHSLDAPGRDVRRTHERDFIRHIADTAEIDETRAERSLMATFKALQVLLNSPSGQDGEADVVVAATGDDDIGRRRTFVREAVLEILAGLGSERQGLPFRFAVFVITDRDTKRSRQSLM